MSEKKPEQNISEMPEYEIIKNILGYNYGRRKRIKRNVRFGEKRFPLDVISLSQLIDITGPQIRKIVYLKTQANLGTYLASVYFKNQESKEDYSLFREVFTEKGYINFKDSRVRVDEQEWIHIINRRDLTGLLETIGHHAHILMFLDLNSPSGYYLTHCVKEEDLKSRAYA